MKYTEKRNNLLNWLRKQLIGPFSESNKLIGISPLERYSTGILFPVIKGGEGIDPAEETENDEEEAAAPDNDSTQKITPVAKSRHYIPPSSAGFSFFVRGDSIRFQVIFSASKYSRRGIRDEQGRFTGTEYEREALGGDQQALTFQTLNSSHKRSSQRQNVLDGKAGIDILWRPFAEGWLVTLTLFNQQELKAEIDPKLYYQERNEKSLFESKLRCIIEEGRIEPYPRVDRSLLSAEELELEFQYKDRHIYAIGHGAAVDWRLEHGAVKEIQSEFLPQVEVPQVTADVIDEDNMALNLAHLATSAHEPHTIDELEQFVEKYAGWITGQKHKSDTADSAEQATAKTIIERMESTLKRMRAGILLLRSDPLIIKSFKYANLAMLNQMRQADKVKEREKDNNSYKWRPFQLDFLLMTIQSAVNEDDEFRDTVDLIWFPTGGGTTEAYLGLIAFIIAWRRLKFPASGGGTTVFMRYTLRLLTVQQYKRATRMICALELIRRRNTELGNEAVTIGLWVGAQTSPNSFASAMHDVQKAEGSKKALQKLVLDSCPWCGTVFKPSENYITAKDKFNFRCSNPECEFARHQNGLLPCNVVDEALYNNPPTLLLATVDKFARLTWDEKAGAFFGVKPNKPPELIIQDELHLIASALGSIAGLYEAAIDTVLQQRGVIPKYIASTATIRMAAQQVERLYGRELAVFPPPGLSNEDSYFARTVPLHKKPGRLYIGYLAAMLNRRSCMVPLAAALYAAPEAVFTEDEQNRDSLLEAWWTQVVYHGSLKGVGNSHNAFVSGVRDFVRRLREEAEQVENTTSITRSTPHIAQLTSISSAEENAATFARLEKKHTDDDYLDAVLATNMISVGLDVERLALMIINGQPLTTAEYIQASSRVGRSEVPGLVFINYYRDQARSLSHYENFRPYHESFYRFVEPTSVTPYTFQARSRALHAALVIAIRHSCPDLLANNSAGSFTSRAPHVQKIIETLKHRCEKADARRCRETKENIDRLVHKWHIIAEECRRKNDMLCYRAPDNDKSNERLLYNYGDKIKGIWQALQSMRNVENTALLKTL